MNNADYKGLYEESKQVLELWKSGLISSENEEFNEFSILKEIAFIEYVYSFVGLLVFEFMGPFTQSFVREMTLMQEIDIIKDKIQSYKSDYPEVYRDVIMGNDGRELLTLEQIQAVLDSGYASFPETALSIHMELIVYIKYLNVLQWIGSTDNKGEIDNYRDFLNVQKQNLRWPVYKESKRLREVIENATKRVKEQISYDWLKNPHTELPKLYSLLIEKQLLHPNTTEVQFKAIFTAQPLQVIEPLRWNKAKNLLAYFLDRVQAYGKITEPNLWSLAEKCFTKSKDLLQSRNNYERINKNKKPKNFKVIDEILNAL